MGGGENGVAAVSGKGGTVTGYGGLGGPRGGRLIRERYSATNYFNSIGIPATGLYAGDQMLLFVSTYTVGNTATVTGWTQLASYTNTNLQGWIFTRAHSPALAGTTVTINTPGSGGYMAVQLIVLTGFGVTYDTPVLQSVSYNTTPTGPHAVMPALGTPGPTATMLSFYAALTLTNSVLPPIAVRSSGLQPTMASPPQGGTNHPWLITALTSAGVEQQWNWGYATDARQVGQIALYDPNLRLPPKNASGKGGQILGYGRFTITQALRNYKGKGGTVTGYGGLGASRGGSLTRVRYSSGVSTTAPSITIPGTGLQTGDRMFWLLTAPTTSATATPPAGWTQLAAFSNAGLQGWIFTRTYTPTIAGTTATASVSGMGGLFLAGQLIVMTGYWITYDNPVLQPVSKSVAQYGFLEMPALGTPAPGATMLSFYAALTTDTTQTQPAVARSSGVQPLLTNANTGSNHPWLFAALTSAGVEQQWSPYSAINARQVGQIAVYDPNVRLPRKNASGKGGQVTGAAALAGGGGVLIRERYTQVGYSGVVTLPSSGIMPGDRMFLFFVDVYDRTLTTPAGWALAGGAQTGASFCTWIFTRIFDVGQGGTSVGAAGASSSAGNQLIAMAGPVTYDTAILQTITYTTTNPHRVTMPAVAAPRPKATVIAFYGALMTTNDPIPAAYQSSGVQPFASHQGGLAGSTRAYFFTAVTTGGVAQIWAPANTTQVRQVGQLAVYDKGPPTGSGGAVTGYDRMAATAGVATGRRPVVREGSQTGLAVDGTRYLRVPIPREVHVGDYLLVAVGVLGTARPVTPAGWQRLMDTTTVAAGVTGTVFGRTAGVYDPGGAVIVDTDATKNTSMTGALAAWKGPGVVATGVYLQTVGGLQVVFGPSGQYRAGHQRVAAGIAAAAFDSGAQVSFTTPPQAPGIAAASVQAQASGGAEPTLSAFVADYDAATTFAGRINAVVPAVAATMVVELTAVEHHESTLKFGGLLTGGPGEKKYPPGTGSSGLPPPGIAGYASMHVPAVQAHGQHRTGKRLIWFDPTVNPFWTVGIDGGPGLVYDSFRGGRITAGGAVTGRGKSIRTGVDQRMVGFGRVDSRKPPEHHESAGGDITAEVLLAVEAGVKGRRSWSGPDGLGPTINFDGVLTVGPGQALARLYITGWADIGPTDGTGAHKGAGNPIIGTPLVPEDPEQPYIGYAYGQITGGEGIKNSSAYLDPAYTQIRGYVRIAADAGQARPMYQGHITAEGDVTAEYIIIYRPEEITLDIGLGYPTIGIDLAVDVEHYVNRILPGNQLVVTKS